MAEGEVIENLEGYKLTFKNKNEANNTLTAIKEHAEKHGNVSVAYVYSLISPVFYSFDKSSIAVYNYYGWPFSDLKEVCVFPTSRGYTFKLPSAGAL